MTDGTRIGIGIGASAAVIAVAFAVTSGDEPSKPNAAPTCTAMLSKHGSFTVPDDAGRCDLLYPIGKRLSCELAPVADITYQWSYGRTPLGLVTTGLKRGAVVAFECKE